LFFDHLKRLFVKSPIGDASDARAKHEEGLDTGHGALIVAVWLKISSGQTLPTIP